MVQRARHRRFSWLVWTAFLAVALNGNATTAALAAADAPEAGFVEAATSTTYIRGANGWSHRVTVRAVKRATGPDDASTSLLVETETCTRSGGCSSEVFSKDIESAEFVMASDGNSATLDTTFAGHDLAAGWKKDSAVGLWSDVGAGAVVLGAGGTARTTLEVFGMKCAAIGHFRRTIEVRPNGFRGLTGEGEPSKVPLEGLRADRKPPLCRAGFDRAALKGARSLQHTEKVIYDAAGSALGVHGITHPAERIGGAVWSTTLLDRYVSIEIEDNSGGLVYAMVGQDTDGDRVINEYHPVCGNTDEPIRIREGLLTAVEIHAGPCLYPRLQQATATWGMLKVTFSYLPLDEKRAR